uniref:SRCR domain-containing protein n=1 Tax=Macrostomum lignano TaxID=282301 RepID=A0A1I8FLN1_9PLAT
PKRSIKFVRGTYAVWHAAPANLSRSACPQSAVACPIDRRTRCPETDGLRGSAVASPLTRKQLSMPWTNEFREKPSRATSRPCARSRRPDLCSEQRPDSARSASRPVSEQRPDSARQQRPDQCSEQRPDQLGSSRRHRCSSSSTMLGERPDPVARSSVQTMCCSAQSQCSEQRTNQCSERVQSSARRQRAQTRCSEPASQQCSETAVLLRSSVSEQNPEKRPAHSMQISMATLPTKITVHVGNYANLSVSQGPKKPGHDTSACRIIGQRAQGGWPRGTVRSAYMDIDYSTGVGQAGCDRLAEAARSRFDGVLPVLASISSRDTSSWTIAQLTTFKLASSNDTQSRNQKPRQQGCCLLRDRPASYRRPCGQRFEKSSSRQQHRQQQQQQQQQQRHSDSRDAPLSGPPHSRASGPP